jgi:gamma-glutamylcysteine synthetase
MSVQHDSHQTLSERAAANTGDEGAGDSLEDAARDEREYARQQLREDLGRDPTEEEVNEWLRQQTEGY